MVHVRTSDIGKGRFEVLQDKFVEVAEKEQNLHGSVLLNSTCTMCRGKQNLIWRFNMWLLNVCRRRGLQVYGAF